MATAVSCQQLDAYMAFLRGGFQRTDQACWAQVYLQGLLSDLPRKTIEQIARQVPLPSQLAVEDPAQALQNFINQSPWDEQKLCSRYRRLMAQRLGRPDGVYVIDEIAFPKQGRYSVGVQRQYSSALGRKTNCQIAVAVHYVSSAGYCPLALRLYLPRSWLHAPLRLDGSGVPPRFRRPVSKAQIALELLDEVRGHGFEGQAVLATRGYGASPEFRAALRERGLFYFLEVGEDLAVIPETAAAGGQPASAPHPLASQPPAGAGNGRPEALSELARRHPVRRPRLRHEFHEPHGPAADTWLRVTVADQGGAAAQTGEPPCWLLLEQRPDGQTDFALAHLPAEPQRPQAAHWRQIRRLVEDGQEHLKERLGLHHFEGRSWRGFHHHACLVLLAHGFLIASERGAG